MSTTTSLSDSLTSTVILPNISPLSDSRKLQPSPILEDIARKLLNSGYEVGLEQGTFQLSPKSSRRVSPLEGLDSYSILNGESKIGTKTRTPSSLTFTRAKSHLVRPRTSDSVSGGSGSILLKAPSGRFSRLGPPEFSSSAEFTTRSGSSRSMLASQNGPRTSVSSQQVRHSMPSSLPSQILSRERDETRSIGEGAASFTSIQDGISTGVACSSAPPKSSAEKMGLAMTGVSVLGSSSADTNGLGDGGTAYGLDTLRAGAAGTSGGSPEPLFSAARPSLLSRERRMAAAPPFRASRAHSLIVFNDIDRDKNGKVTRSEFEEIALSLGLSLPQAHAVFDKLDSRRRGFLESTDWGRPDCSRQVETLSTIYMQKFLGVPDLTSTPEQVQRYWQQQQLRQVKSLAAAINLVRVNAVTRATHSPLSSGNVVYDTFRFIDTDGSGDLSKEEIRDAFLALGVFLSDSVTSQIMSVFDSNGDGSVNYVEFVKTMFPNAHKANTA